MTDPFRAARPWLMFTGGVLVVAVLYLAQAVLVPVALAVLLAFLLTPIVVALQRRIGRVAAVLTTVVVTFGALCFAGWIVTQQLGSLVQELPAYRHNIHQKIQDVRGAGKGGSVEALQKTVEDIEQQMGTTTPGESRAPGTPAKPLVVRPEQVSGLWSFPAVVGPFLAPLSTAGLVFALVIFILLEREELRNRLIRIFGHGRLVTTTKAFDEAGRRVSRYLLTQSLVNLVYAVCVAIALFAIGVPYASLWAALGGALRFIPYVGPIVGAAAPFVISLAALEGWARPAMVFGSFVVIELFTNLVLEAVLYAGAIGVSQVALLVAVAFWSWLWGPLGLLLATPLTVCLVVMGKYVPGLEFVSLMLSDEPVLPTDVSYYQRLLAGDHAEASELIERHLAGDAPESVYDDVMLPALSYAERDRIEGRLEAEEERAVIEATGELLAETLDLSGRGLTPSSGGKVDVLGLAAAGTPDALALRMLAQLLQATPVVLDVRDRATLSADVLEAVKLGRYRAVCIADIPPSGPSRSRYVVKRLRALAPDLPIVVGRWAPDELADENGDTLTAVGATHVASRLLDTRLQLLRLAAVPLAGESSPNAA
jgi:predicted PurR-regulated permease PerM